MRWLGGDAATQESAIARTKPDRHDDCIQQLSPLSGVGLTLNVHGRRGNPGGCLP